MSELTAALQGDDLIRFASDLRRLLAIQTDLYTAGDSTSLPSETAGELLESVSFVLRLRLRELGRPLQSGDDGEKLFREGLITLERLLKRCRSLYSRALFLKGEWATIALSSSLESIGRFFRIYDGRFMAHRLPCELDYRPCIPVSEDLAGAEYLERYLRHIVYECGFLRLFPQERCAGLLYAWQPGYRLMVTDIFEPVLANAMGRLILGTDPRGLALTAEDISTLERICSGRESAILSAAAETLIREMITDEGQAGYIREAALSILPRMASAASFNKIFTVF